MEIISYDIVKQLTGDPYIDITDFSEKVEKRMEKGWKPLGGITIVEIGEGQFMITQVIVKYK